MKYLTAALLAASLVASGVASAEGYQSELQRDVTLASAAEGTGHVDIASSAKSEGHGAVEMARTPSEGYTAPGGTATA